jgi:outer membrane protein assembly factor BamE (lipoprotein component of BamABCDE complex)
MSAVKKPAGRATAIVLAGLLGAGVMLSGCAETITKHGHQFRETDLQQVTTGMSQDQVKLTLGTPTTTSAVATGNTYYYIASTEAEKSFLSPRETDRQVVAIYFNQGGSVEQVANYGLKDGKVFDFISRKTPAPGSRDEGLLKSLFRNLGHQQLFGN